MLLDGARFGFCGELKRSTLARPTAWHPFQELAKLTEFDHADAVSFRIREKSALRHVVSAHVRMNARQAHVAAT